MTERDEKPAAHGRDGKPAEGKPADGKAAEGKPAEGKAADGKAAEGKPADDELTIDELSASTRVPSRTVRFYQSKGVLGPPRIRGRVAYYGPEHARRLELIAQLQDRGLRIDAIRELLTRVDRGEVDVADWLGLEAQLKAPWAHDHPRTFTEAEMGEMLRDRRPGLLAELVRSGALARRNDAYLSESPALLRVAIDLDDAGVEPAVAVKAGETLRKHLGRAASELAELFFEQARRGESDQDLTRQLDVLRPRALEAVRLVFGREMETVLRGWVASGKTSKLPGKKRR